MASAIGNVKWCPGHKDYCFTDEFPKCQSRPDGCFLYCKDCTSKSNKSIYSKLTGAQKEKRLKTAKAWTRNNPERSRQKAIECKRRKTFGLRHGEYELMFEQQDGCCAICKKPESRTLRGKRVELSVDHDHKTGKIRQLLCTRCNQGIGMFLDNPELAEAAAAYLRRHKES